MDNNVISFVQKAQEKGRVLQVPPRVLPKGLDISREDVETVHTFTYEYPNEIVRIDLNLEGQYITATFVDKPSQSIYNQVELDYQSMHELIETIQDIQKRLSGEDTNRKG